MILARILIVTGVASCGGCASSKASSATPSPVSSVEPRDLARVLVDIGPYKNFTLLVHPAAMPKQGRLECHWSEERLERYEFVETGAPGDQWWRLPTPPNSMGLGAPDLSITERAAKVVDGQVISSEKQLPQKGEPVWHVAFLCGRADLAVFNVGYYCGALCGQGYRITLRRRDSGWELGDVRSTWAA